MQPDSMKPFSRLSPEYGYYVRSMLDSRFCLIRPSIMNMQERARIIGDGR